MINANREARTPTLSQEPGASARASGSTEEGERERGNGREGKIEAFKKAQYFGATFDPR